jgi:hypothetical protein
MDEFKDEINRLVKSEDVLYIALNKNYWISFDEFLKLKSYPKLWETLFKDGRNWEGIDPNFRIVLKDGGWYYYYYCYDDPYYSCFIYNKQSKKPDKKYCEEDF